MARQRALPLMQPRAGRGSTRSRSVADSVHHVKRSDKSQGIFYFVSHRALWQPFVSKLPQYIALYGSVTAGMFTFTYLPQLAVMVFVNGPLAVVTTVFLVLNESATIVNMISRNYMLQDSLLNTFDGTLLARNKTGIVQQGREVKSGSDPIARLGKVLRSPFDKFSPKAIVRYFLYLPLNFIPVAGTVIFIFFQARGRGKSVHDRVRGRFKLLCRDPC